MVSARRAREGLQEKAAKDRELANQLREQAQALSPEEKHSAEMEARAALMRAQKQEDVIERRDWYDPRASEVFDRASHGRAMLQFMARENQEDYNTNFLAMLEVWEAGERFCAEQHSGAIAPKVQIFDIAALLGWTTIRAKEETRQGEIRANTTACVCHDASALIQAGHVTRQDLRDLSVYAVRELCGGLMTRLMVLERAKAERREGHGDCLPESPVRTPAHRLNMPTEAPGMANWATLGESKR